ncbi:hypothetical protein PV02_11890 [Methanolobus chelungpuianus]|uniref:PGF-CTERM archaeal protein-sorting signal domain-containing protein n=2 Tax=Methanolobus chelungpuianus TaxID=502115 RepID=A0AAE3HBX9_9EURY|nr:hypothetical protein [Methanolobus chelungpuianus]
MVLSVLLIVPGISVVSAIPSYLESFNQQYDTNGTRLDSCNICHTDTEKESINSYASDYSESGRDFSSIEALDSDEDGFTNIEEINALTLPGDPADRPQTTEAPSETGANETDEQQTPGFEGIAAVIGLMAAVYLMGRNSRM